MTDTFAVVAPAREERSTCGVDVSLSVEGACLLVALSGEIDADNIAALPTVVAAASNGDEAVLLDISDVSFFDSSLLRAILMCEAMLAATGVELKVRGASPHAQRIFEITNLSYLLE